MDEVLSDLRPYRLLHKCSATCARTTSSTASAEGGSGSADMATISTAAAPPAGPEPQSGWLVRLARDEALQRALSTGRCPLPAPTLERLVEEHSLQVRFVSRWARK